MRIMKLIKTCVACPSQWEGIIVNEGLVYIRFRFGQLTINFTEHGIDAVLGRCIFKQQIGDELDGCLTNAQLQEILKDEYEIIYEEDSNEL